MNPKTIIAIVLIALGFAVLVYPGLNFTTPGETVNFFGIVIETRAVSYTHLTLPTIYSV